MNAEDRDIMRESIRGILEASHLSEVRDSIVKGQDKLESGNKMMITMDRVQTVIADKVKDVKTSFRQDLTLLLAAEGSEISVGGRSACQWSVSFNPDTLGENGNREAALEQITACEEAQREVHAAYFEQARRVVAGEHDFQNSRLGGAIATIEEPDTLVQLTDQNFTIDTVDFRAMRLAAKNEAPAGPKAL